ncbi:MAG: transposase [Pseudomonadota bacterium]
MLVADRCDAAARPVPGLDAEDIGIYKPRRPQETVLYRTIQENLETWLTTVREADPDSDPVPSYVENEFRKTLTCGILCHGFCRCVCTSATCRRQCLVAFSCRARAVCCSCAARYMNQTASHLLDNVLPRTPFRQWVLVLPKRLRFFLQRDSKHAGGVLRILLRALDTAIRKASPGAPRNARIGAVSFIQRFGSSLNEHLHYHSAVTDGVFSENSDGQIEFFEATGLTPQIIEELCETLRRRILRYFVRHGLLDEAAAEAMLAWEHSGFSLDASIRIEDWDRMALERLIRYCARPPFAEGRLQRSGDGTILYLPGDSVQNPGALAMTPVEFLQKLSALIPPPRVHRHRFWGVLAPHSRLRGKVIDSAAPAGVLAAQLQQAAARMGIDTGQDYDDRPAGDHGLPGEDSTPPPAKPASNKSARARRLSMMWAMLIARIHEALPLLCPKCGEPMKIISFITEPEPIEKILRHIGEPTEPPPLSPARAPPQCDLDFYDDPA